MVMLIAIMGCALPNGSKEYYGNERNDKKTGKQVELNGRDVKIENNDDLTVRENVNEDIGKNKNVIVRGNSRVSVGGHEFHDIGRAHEIRAGERILIESEGYNEIRAGEHISIESGGDNAIRAAKNFKIWADESAFVQTNGWMYISAGKNIQISSQGNEVRIDVNLEKDSATVIIDKNGDISLHGRNITLDASGKINMIDSTTRKNAKRK